nr:hypothetical protein [uncultured Tateyamaria sp.]
MQLNTPFMLMSNPKAIILPTFQPRECQTLKGIHRRNLRFFTRSIIMREGHHA